MRPLFLDGELTVANLQHIRVVVAVEVDTVKLERVQVEDLSHTRPIGCNIDMC